MKNLCFRAITMALGLYFTGAMTNPARKSSIFFNSEHQWNGYRLTNCSFTGKQDIPVDISQTAATVDASSIFFRVLLQSPTKEEKQNIKHLDLSNNLMLKIALSPLAHLPGLETLNLSNNAIHSISLDLPGPKCSWVKRHRSSLRRGLPHLKLLILQRNKLSDIPKGLWKLKSLQSLDLSFNGILQIGMFDFHNCLQLENLYLRSNKIFRIHPEAFKDLKKLQVVDLSSNALTAILPMMTIALELPHLEADLAHNQWQCDDSVTIFQNVISESWRRKWDVICNKSIGHEEAYGWTPRSRIPREAHLPHTNRNHRKSLLRSKAGRPQAGMHVGSSTPGKKDRPGSDAGEQHRRPPRRVRSTQDVQAAGRTEAASQDLALAVCLAVFITFFVAFCLGALTRPYIDRLWQRRCRKKRPGPALGYSNQGFYDETEAAGAVQHPRVDLHQAHHGLSLCAPQDAFSGTQASPQAAVIAGKKEPGHGQSRGPRGVNTGAGRRKDHLLPNGQAAGSVIRGGPGADSNPRALARQDRVCRHGLRGEVDSETEDSLSEHSVGIPAIAGRLRTGSGSIHKDSNALDPPLSREMTAALSQTQICTKAQRTGGPGDREGAQRAPLEFPKEVPVRTPSLLDAQGASAEKQHPTYYGSAQLGDLGHVGPSPKAFPPARGRDLHVTPAHEDPAQRHAPPDTRDELDTNSDSDEGSLFTLSSVSSEGARNVSGEEADGEESPGTSELPEDGDPGVRRDTVTSSESLEDITFRKAQGKCENQEDPFGKPLISGSDSGLTKSHRESASDTHTCENPGTVPGSLGDSAARDTTPGTFTYGCVTAPRSEAAGWHCSLRDLEFSTVETPPCPAEAPPGPDKTACGERDADMCTYEPLTQGSDPDESNRPSQHDSAGGSTHSSPMDTGAPEAHESREAMSPTQLLQFSGDEPAPQGERGGGDYFEEGSKSQVLLLQALPNKTSPLRTREPFGDGDGGKYSEENLLQLETDDSDFCTQMQTHSDLMGVARLGEDRLSYNKDEDVQRESQRQCK
ncbi:leucine-rich repeat-containing protein 66 [Myotis myotis]|uniref:Leucine rich repeat containing 66 n=1 Tax=Myotis myotis TaxID=51298 RepID=A0A7J8AMY7_MYOMY|nr:leucine-rich repeat-containing protein 66 [Myotis myotis]KAF6387812.1 leucine rich repeat containing 66 [Myotis myotis]